MKNKQTKPYTSINIATDSKSVVAVGKVIMDILKTSCAEGVKVAALEALVKTCSINNTSISNCSFMSKT
jgi:hypothetical protein